MSKYKIGELVRINGTLFQVKILNTTLQENNALIEVYLEQIAEKAKGEDLDDYYDLAEKVESVEEDKTSVGREMTLEEYYEFVNQLNETEKKNAKQKK